MLPEVVQMTSTVAGVGDTEFRDFFRTLGHIGDAIEVSYSLLSDAWITAPSPRRRSSVSGPGPWRGPPSSLPPAAVNR